MKIEFRAMAFPPPGLIALAVTLFNPLGVLEAQAAKTRNPMAEIERQVAEDAEQQYEMVSRHGSQIDRCAYAGMVSAAYLQAKDEWKYRHWKLVERTECRKAGIPQD